MAMVGDSLREVARCMDDVVGFVKPSVPDHLHAQLKKVRDEFAALVRDIESERYKLWLVQIRADRPELQD